MGLNTNLIEIRLLPSTDAAIDKADLARLALQQRNAGTRLLRLPGELRNKIYVATLGGYVICAPLRPADKGFYFCNIAGGSSQVVKLDLSFPEVWRVCRQLYIETRLVPYTANSFDDTYFYKAWTMRDKFPNHALALRFVTCIHLNDLKLLKRYLKNKSRNGHTLDGLHGKHLFGMEALQTIIFSTRDVQSWLYFDEDSTKVQLWQGEKIKNPSNKDILAMEAEGQERADQHFMQEKAKYDKERVLLHNFDAGKSAGTVVQVDSGKESTQGDETQAADANHNATTANDPMGEDEVEYTNDSDSDDVSSIGDIKHRNGKTLGEVKAEGQTSQLAGNRIKVLHYKSYLLLRHST